MPGWTRGDLMNTKTRDAHIATLSWQESGTKQTYLRFLFNPFYEAFCQRGLIWLLIDKELRARYKGSALGILWSLAKPITQLLIYYVAIGEFLGASRSIPSFAIFVLIGLTAWSFFSDVASQSSQAILGNAGIIKKIHIPRIIFPLSVVGSSLIYFFIQFLVLGIFILLVGKLPEFPQFWLLFPSTAILVLFGTGTAYLISSINVFIRDLQHLVDVSLSILFWLSPIVYSYKFVVQAVQNDFLLNLYLANPVTISILGFQRALWRDGTNDLVNFPEHLIWRIAIMCAAGVVFLLISQSVFKKFERNFAQEI
jgi:ABC-2 type transport system permease protein